MKISISKEKIGCPHSQRVCGHLIFELCNRISPWKRKISHNRFCLFIWCPGRIFLSKKNSRKSGDTVPLSKQKRDLVILNKLYEDVLATLNV